MSARRERGGERLRWWAQRGRGDAAEMMIRKGGRTMLGFVPITRLPVSDNLFDIDRCARGNVANE